MFRKVLKCLVVCLMMYSDCYAEPFFFTPHQSGTYDHHAGVAVFLASEIAAYNKRKLLYVDFSNQKMRVLGAGGLNYVACNYNCSLVAFSYTTNAGVKVVDLDGERVFDVGGDVYRGVVRWAYNKNKLAYYDDNKKRVYEISVDDGSIISAEAFGELYRVEWDDGREEFLFEFGPSGNQGLDGVFRLTNTGLKKASIATLNVSPGGEYSFESISEFETPNVFNIIDNNGEVVASLISASQVLAGSGLIWGERSLRVTGSPSGNIELKTGKILNRSTGFSSGDDERFRRSKIYTDVASDKRGYVLVWNREEKVFEVEDVDTGEVIKTYEMFW